MKQIAEAFGRRLRDTGITRIQWIAMYYISTNKMISQRELSLLMHVADSSIGRLLDRLERDEMVVRSTNESDRRVTMVILTERGEELMSRLIPYGERFNDDLIEGIHQEELMIFQNVLEKMTENTKKINTEIREL